MNIKKIITIGISLLMFQSLYFNNIESYALPSVDNEHDYGFIERNSFGISYEGDFWDFYPKQTVITSDGGYLELATANTVKIEGLTKQENLYGALLKYSSSGVLEWSKSIGGNMDSFMYEIKEVSDGYILIYSSEATNIEGLTNKGYDDAIIVKYDKQGNQQWINSFAGNDNDNFVNFFEVDDGYICFGYSSSTNIPNYTNKGWYDNIIVKYNNQGQQQWVKSWGGNNGDVIEKVIKTNDGYVILGTSNSTNINGLTNNGGMDITISKYDNNFNLLLVKSFGGNMAEEGYSIIQTADNGYVVVGDTTSLNMYDIVNKGNCDAFVLKVNENLEKEWVKFFGGNGSDRFLKAQETSDNGFLLSGETFSDTFEGISIDGGSTVFIKLSANGDLNFMKTYDDNYLIEDMIPVNDYFIAVGSQLNYEIDSPNGEEDTVILGFDNNGNEFYKKLFTGNGFDFFTNIIPTNNNDYLLIGASDSSNLDNISNTLGKTVFFKVVSEEQIVKRLQTSQSLDLQVVADNSLEMSLSTNQISFKGYNGVSDLTNNDLNITVTSGLYYDLFATLNDELRGSNDTDAIINKNNLGIKTLEDSDYKNFVNIGTPLKLVDNHVNGRNINHNINLKLKGDSSVKADTYSTTITFETIQK